MVIIVNGHDWMMQRQTQKITISQKHISCIVAPCTSSAQVAIDPRLGVKQDVYSYMVVSGSLLPCKFSILCYAEPIFFAHCQIGSA